MLIKDPFKKGLIYEEKLDNEVCRIYFTPLISPLGMIYKLTMLVPIGSNDEAVKAQLIGKFPLDENEEKIAFLEKIDADPYFQGKGYGTLLLSVYLKHMENMGIEKILSTKARYDERLVRFYKKFGFDIDYRKLTLYISKNK